MKTFFPFLNRNRTLRAHPKGSLSDGACHKKGTSDRKRLHLKVDFDFFVILVSDFFAFPCCMSFFVETGVTWW
ncbi:hypothetical protein HRI_004031000 [Hibiscus trionum]|uniref:Uncharacterized protein n=1 Tax=Hibiscus trionum TaxID=183268 RepID=A0A9W7IW11_HIBTR|nr:hypothetical protein HRI_004031000 [Hibiscus trionum]